MRPLHTAIYDGGLGAGWTTLLADLVALLLSFFILLFSITPMSHGSWSAMTRSLALQLNAGEPTIDGRSNIGDRVTPGLSLSYVARLLEHQRDRNQLLAQATLIEEKDRLILRLPRSALLGDEGGISEEIAVALDGLGELVTRIELAVNIAVHSAPGRPKEEAWSQGIADAARVAAGMTRTSSLPQITLLAVGDAEFPTFLTNYELDERYARAERIEIALISRTVQKRN